MYITICETDCRSRFNAWDRVLRAGALGWPWGMGWGGRWEGGSCSWWGTHVHPWLMHVNVWQKPPHYCKVISLQLKKKNPCFQCKGRRFNPWSGISPRGGNDNSLQYSCLENPMDRGAWWVTIHGVTKSWTWLSIAFFISLIIFFSSRICLVIFDHFHLSVALILCMYCLFQFI